MKTLASQLIYIPVYVRFNINRDALRGEGGCRYKVPVVFRVGEPLFVDSVFCFFATLQGTLNFFMSTVLTLSWRLRVLLVTGVGLLSTKP